MKIEMLCVSFRLRGGELNELMAGKPHTQRSGGVG